MEITFYGAAGEVTGSCHLLRVGGRLILLDCGLIQGSRKQEARNRDPFLFDPTAVDAVVLSHAHLDHSGRLPVLVKQGFRGPIYAHNATRALCEVLLADAASLSERDAEQDNRRRARKGLAPIEPLYTRADVGDVLRRVSGMRYEERKEILPGVRLCFRDAGHIMGSAVIELWLREGDLERKVVFSGDLGQHGAPILRDPTPVAQADLVLMESTSGGRVPREREATIEEIGRIVSDAEHDRGNILIPAFAVGRSQEILYLLGKHYRPWDLDRWHVFLDSPMAIEATRIYWSYPHLYDDEATTLRRGVDEMPRLRNLHLTATTEESRVINRLASGAIIIAGSGMCNGGRILHHLKHNIWRRESHIVIVGYQAQGTLGRRLVDRAERVRIFGETMRVAAHVHTVGGLSAHGDENDLLRWYRAFDGTPPVYLVHGELDASHALAEHLRRACRAHVTLALPGYRVNLARLPHEES